MNKIKILGLGQDFLDLFPSYKKIISSADLLIGGRRQLEVFEDVSCEKMTITPPIASIIEYIKGLKDKQIVILADGDPLFFGIGERLVRELGVDRVEIFPNVSVVQRAASRLKVSIRDIYTISLHGRGDIFDVLSAISWHNYVGIYTDRYNSPDRIAKKLLKREILGFKVHVFENLGTVDERHLSLSVQEAASFKFVDPNFVILECIRPREIYPHIGMEDNLFIRDKNQITKKEVRVLSLSQMQITEHSCILDIGAGSGSMSIESLVMAKKGKVFAVEIDSNRAEIIKRNRDRFGLYSIEIINKDAKDAILDLPRPDRIFIGGGISKENKLLEMAYDKLRPNGRLVVNTVLVDTYAKCIEFCKTKSIYYEIMQVHVDRGEVLGRSIRMVPINPVMIITLIKEI